MDLPVREGHRGDAEGIIAYMQALAAEPNNGTLFGPGEFTVSIEEEQEILDRFATSDNSALFIVHVGEQIVGIASVQGGRRKAARHTGTIAITLRADYRDRGLGTRLMHHIIGWAKDTGVLKRLDLEVFSNNKRAIRLYEKMGFKHEGCRVRAFFKDGEYLDSLMMALWLDEAASC